MNNEILNFMGSIIMWFSLCHIYSGFNLSVYSERFEVELAYMNCLIAGGFGGFAAFLFKNAID